MSKWSSYIDLAGPPGISMLTSQSVGLGPGGSVTGALSATTPLMGVYPATSQVVPFVPSDPTALMGLSYSNPGPAMTLALVDQTLGATVYSTAITGVVTGYKGIFGIGDYPMVKGHTYVWQATAASGTANFIFNPLYLYPAVSSVYSVSALSTAALAQARAFSATAVPLNLGASTQSHTFKLPRVGYVYRVTVINTSTGALTLTLTHNAGGTVVALTAPPGATTTFGPYGIGVYTLVYGPATGATGQYYWTAKGSGTGTVFVDTEVLFAAP